MNIGIVTIAYNGYGRFLPQWCRAIAELTRLPAAVTVALGKDHGATPEMIAEARRHVPILQIVDAGDTPSTMGAMRNVAVEHTAAEWIMYLSVDDAILPHAIEEFERYEHQADYICIRWLTRGLGKKEIEHVPKLPIEMATKYRGRGFIVGHSPFRRRFWEKAPYEPHDYPNAPFLASMVENAARFVRTERPCTVYQRRSDSHSRGILFKSRTEKRKAIHYKREMQRRIVGYYEYQRYE
ncbi:MAG: glycosyltransferase family A protein [Thalassobaculum sp.]|uniref:glycosyltransferase family A protein n=1 Tax=Thalassobaculum sp. TaxID=2022740 RepID=UPI0032EB84CB